MPDGRRRRWIPLSVEFPFDKTGTRLQEEFGPAGLGVWCAMLTAAKRAPIQGTFSYTTESEAWERLGIIDPPFALDDFFKVTGRMKKTRKRRRGRITDIQITAWEQWNNTEKSEVTRQRNARSKQETTGDLQSTESEIESEIEIDESNPFLKFLKPRTDS